MKCSCGSGKKYKNCCLGKKERLRTLEITLPDGSRPAGLRVTRNGIAVVDVNGQPIASDAYVETYYKRERKNKTLHKLRLGDVSMHVDINRELLRYENFACIDTNTRVDAEYGLVSVSGVVLGFYSNRDETSGEIGLSHSCGFEFRGLDPTQAERHGLRLLLTSMREDPKFKGRTAVVIDHDHERIFRLNSRQEPILDSFYLPEDVELIYATSDSGTEFPPNRMIKDADRFAAAIMDYILASDEKRDGRHLGTDVYGVPFSQWLEGKTSQE